MTRSGNGRRERNTNQGAKDLGMLGRRQGKTGWVDDPMCRKESRRGRERRGRSRLPPQSDIGLQAEMAGSTNKHSYVKIRDRA